jgi:hypothetical protein
MIDLSLQSQFLANCPQFISFVDESGHSKDPAHTHLCLAGLLATRDAWAAFNDEWRAVRASFSLCRPLHMKDFAAFRGEFINWDEARRRLLLTSLMGLLGKARAIPVGSVVDIAGYDKVFRETKVDFRDPHFLAFQGLTYQLAVAASMQFPPGPVTMVYAKHPEHSVGLANTENLWQAVREANGIVALFMDSYRAGEPADHAGLEAADVWAYELRRHFEHARPQSSEPRWAFKEFVKLGLNYRFTHDFVTHYDEHGMTGVGKMSRVQRLGEVDLFKPGFTGLHPTQARELDRKLRREARAPRATRKIDAAE